MPVLLRWCHSHSKPSHMMTPLGFLLAVSATATAVYGYDFNTITGLYYCSQDSADYALTAWESRYGQSVDQNAQLTVQNNQVVPSCSDGYTFTDESVAHDNCYHYSNSVGYVVRKRDLFKMVDGIKCEAQAAPSEFDFSQFDNKAKYCNDQSASASLSSWSSEYGQSVDPRARLTVSNNKLVASCSDGYTFKDTSIDHNNCFYHSSHGYIVMTKDIYKIIDGITCEEPAAENPDTNEGNTGGDESDEGSEGVNEGIPEFQRRLLNGHQCSEQPIEPKFFSSGFHIVGGKEAVSNSWPWQVRLIVLNSDGSLGLCGGTLISDQYVLSASHCIMNKDATITLDAKTIWIAPGRHEDPMKAPIARQRDGSLAYTDSDIYQVEAFRSNPVWPTEFPNNDLSVFKLSKKVEFNNKVQPSCIPTTNVAESGVECVATGWGGTNYATMPQSKFLQQITGRTMSDSNCRGTMEGGFSFRGSTVVCMEFIDGATQQQNVGTAGGDSGGPIHCKFGDRYYSAGALSGGSPGLAIYAEFVDHLDFIEKSINEM